MTKEGREHLRKDPAELMWQERNLRVSKVQLAKLMVQRDQPHTIKRAEEYQPDVFPELSF